MTRSHPRRRKCIKCGRLCTIHSVKMPKDKYVCGLCRPKKFSDDELERILDDARNDNITTTTIRRRIKKKGMTKIPRRQIKEESDEHYNDYLIWFWGG